MNGHDRHVPRALKFAAVLLLCAATVVEAAEVRRTDDYVAVVIEAESFDSKDDRWVETDATTPQIEDDPDGNHSDGAVGGRYLELLPDVRVTHQDPFGPPQGYWPRAGDGPTAHYSVDFPEAGVYHVHLRGYVTGTEDNGIHVGLDGDWPASGARLQMCGKSLQTWFWSSNQRESGGKSCGVPYTIWLTVDEPGVHDVVLSAREDGFEVDRFMLVKDLSGNTKSCAPEKFAEDEIVCKEGGIESSDEIVDLVVEAETDPEIATVGEPLEISVTVSNEDALDAAHDIVLDVEVDPEAWQIDSASDGCEITDGVVSCVAERLEPKLSSDAAFYSVTLTPLRSGSLDIALNASASEIDLDDTNNTAQLAIETREPLAPASLGVDATLSASTVSIGERFTVRVEIENLGELHAEAVELSVRPGSGLAVTDLAEGCSLADRIVACALASLAAGDAASVELPLRADVAGAPVVEIVARSDTADTVTTNRLIVVTDDGSGGSGGGADGAEDSGGADGAGGIGTTAGDAGAGTATGTDGETSGSGASTDGGDTSAGDSGDGKGDDSGSDRSPAAGATDSVDGEVPGGESANDSSGGSGSVHPALWWLAALVTFMRLTRRRAQASP